MQPTPQAGPSQLKSESVAERARQTMYGPFDGHKRVRTSIAERRAQTVAVILTRDRDAEGKERIRAA